MVLYPFQEGSCKFGLNRDGELYSAMLGLQSVHKLNQLPISLCVSAIFRVTRDV